MTSAGTRASRGSSPRRRARVRRTGRVASSRAARSLLSDARLGSRRRGRALRKRLLNAWRALPRFEGRSSLKSWLYTIATNACLKDDRATAPASAPARLRSRGRPARSDSHHRSSSPSGSSYYPGPASSPRTTHFPRRALRAARERRTRIRRSPTTLPARQRAVLILRDVLGFSAKEVAGALEMTPAAVDTALQRAHKTADAATARPKPAGHPAGARRRAAARARRRLRRRLGTRGRRRRVAMLAHDATIAMPPQPTWYRGRDAIETFLRSVALAPGLRWRLLPARANGQLAFGEYRWNETTKRFVGRAVMVLTIADATDRRHHRIRQPPESSATSGYRNNSRRNRAWSGSRARHEQRLEALSQPIV